MCVQKLTVTIMVVAPMKTGGGELVTGLTDCKHSQHITSHLVCQPYRREGRGWEERGGVGKGGECGWRGNTIKEGRERYLLATFQIS